METEEVARAADEAMPDLEAMSAEEIVDWLLSEPDPIPLASFPLQTGEGRREFLREYVRRGKEARFEAVSHVWASLNEPQETRCTAMGIAAGTGGKGKVALMNLLSAVLEEVLSINPILPRTANFPSLDEWHQAVLASFDDEEVRTEATLQKYADILNGSAEPKPSPSAEVIDGPWDANGPVP